MSFCAADMPLVPLAPEEPFWAATSVEDMMNGRVRMGVKGVGCSRQGQKACRLLRKEPSVNKFIHAMLD
jgi:hypothetical protein